VAVLDAGNGLTVVDPHGSLVEDLLDAISESTMKSDTDTFCGSWRSPN
jgi:hypothetical protein